LRIETTQSTIRKGPAIGSYVEKRAAIHGRKEAKQAIAAAKHVIVEQPKPFGPWPELDRRTATSGIFHRNNNRGPELDGGAASPPCLLLAGNFLRQDIYRTGIGQFCSVVNAEHLADGRLTIRFDLHHELRI